MPQKKELRRLANGERNWSVYNRLALQFHVSPSTVKKILRMDESQLEAHENGRKRARKPLYFELDAFLLERAREKRGAGLEVTAKDLLTWGHSFREMFLQDESSPEDRKAVYRTGSFSDNYISALTARNKGALRPPEENGYESH